MGFRMDDRTGEAVAPVAMGTVRVLGPLGMRLVGGGTFHLDEGPEMAWVNPYRLLARGVLLGYGRTTAATSFGVEDGAAVVRWDPFEGHPLHMEVRTVLVDERTVDTTFSVRAAEAVEDYEILVSSYFTPNQTPWFRVKTHPFLPDTTWFSKQGREFEPTSWPRDEHGAGLLFDGRWSTGHPPLWWIPGSFYAEPLMLQTHRWTGLSIATMARPDDCACISGLVGYHNSQYVHLWGRTLAAGDEATATVRTVFVQGGGVEGAQAAAEAAYAAFVAS